MTLKEWTDLVGAELALDENLTKQDIDLLLAVARDAAHSIARPAAPLTTYLLGIAVGRGADPTTTAELLQRLALAQKNTQDTQDITAPQATTEQQAGQSGLSGQDGQDG